MAKFRIPLDRTRSRAKLYQDRFSDLTNNPDMAFYKLGVLENEYAEVVAECYFLVSEFYKLCHGIPETHNTEFSKIAGITSVVISNRKLLQRRSDLTNDDTYAVLNPLFGIRLGMDRLGIDLAGITFEELDRLIQFLIDPELQCLDNYFWKLSKKKHVVGNEIEFDITPYEMGFIEGVVSNFHFIDKALRLSDDPDERS